MKDYKCIYCGREIKNAGSLAVHQKQCKSNPNRIERKKRYGGKTTNGMHPWNFGLNKNDDERIKKQSDTLHKRYSNKEIIPSWLGKKHKEQTKQKISKSMKQRFKENPKVKPFGGCRGKMSSYEHWFCQKVVKEHNLAQKFDIINQYYEYPYFLDFAFLNARLDVQIDGQFHIKEDMVISDKIRQDNLISKNWLVYHISSQDIKNNEQKIISDFLKYLDTLNDISQKVLGNQIVLYRKYKPGRIKYKQ